ncbi:flavin reductase family protein [Chloroflexota bacterium]
MRKILMGQTQVLETIPTILVGVNVNGKPNFMTVAGTGIANGEPPMLAVPIRPNHYTHKGITQNFAFSVNIPSADLVKETDYCGIVSGYKVNKAKACKFNVFYGKLGNVPLIEQCPVNLECIVLHILRLDSHSLVVGRVEEAHVSEICLTNGQPDIDKIKPFVYTIETGHPYQALGQVIGKAFHTGQELKG